MAGLDTRRDVFPLAMTLADRRPLASRGFGSWPETSQYRENQADPPRQRNGPGAPGQPITLDVHNTARYSTGVCWCRSLTAIPRRSGIANEPVGSGQRSTGPRIANCCCSTQLGPSTTSRSLRRTGWRSFAATGPAPTASGSTTSGASASAGRPQEHETWRSPTTTERKKLPPWSIPCTPRSTLARSSKTST